MQANESKTYLRSYKITGSRWYRKTPKRHRSTKWKGL